MRLARAPAPGGRHIATTRTSPGGLERIHVHGMSLPDAICYLPSRLLLSTEASWDELIAQWRADAAPKEPSNLEKWLRERKLLPPDPRALDALIEDVASQARRRNEHLHPNLVALGVRVLDLGHSR